MLTNQRKLYPLLFDCAAQSLLEFGRNRLRGDLGITAVLHTWEQKLHFHPHLHCIVTGGTLSPDSKQWHSPKQRKFLFPVRAVAALFRGKFLAGLRQMLAEGELHLPDSALKIASRRARWFSLLYEKRWRITLLASDAGLRNIKERIQGYREALLSANLSKFEQIVMAGRNDVESVKGALEPILLKRPRPSAVFAATQNMTLGALKLIWQLGLNLPKDISLLAFDDSEWLTALRPFISTVSQPADEFADEAWATLMTRLSKDRSPKLHSEVHCSLIPRESTRKYRP